VGTDVDSRSTPAADDQRPHLPILTFVGLGPVESNDCARFGRGLEPEPLSGASLPGLEGPLRKLSISGPKTGVPGPIRDEIGDRALGIQSPGRGGLARARPARAHGHDDRRDEEPPPVRDHDTDDSLVGPPAYMSLTNQAL